ncbi:MAG: bifunctional hydroxymethylpyrimidine kinase/phosphomethylpyrimidine kinase [Rhodobacteraceae bacterium]|nr:bifunctional hydroxymethylpyrimidine kinase/phosphomethylpyrimidine kinase [Paracoccaceae bacterium]
MIPNVLTIAGSDPSGGAGIQADIKAISANGGYAMAVITGLTVQNTMGVQRVAMVDSGMVQAQIASICDDIRIDAIKIGMLGDEATTRTVATSLETLEAPVVLDPVMVAKGGDRLLEPAAVKALQSCMIPLATVITPNIPEAADLLGTSEAQTLEEMLVQGSRLLALGCRSVYIKGGHLSGAKSTDLLVTEAETETLRANRIMTRNTHGTGCTFAAALATQIAHGHALTQAARHAKSYITAAIRDADTLSVGNGHGPVHHFPHRMDDSRHHRT